MHTQNKKQIYRKIPNTSPLKYTPPEYKPPTHEMFVRILIVHCDENNCYKITINGFQVKNINEIRNIIFGLRYGKPSSALRPKLGCSPS